MSPKLKALFKAILVTFYFLGAIFVMNLYIDAEEKSTNNIRNIL
jgi:hypothetical protein